MGRRAQATPAQMLREHRDRNGMTLVDMAKKLGLSVSFLCDVDHGRRKLSALRAWQCASSLGEDGAQWIQSVLQEQLDELGLKPLRVYVKMLRGGE